MARPTKAITTVKQIQISEKDFVVIEELDVEGAIDLMKFFNENPSLDIRSISDTLFTQLLPMVRSSIIMPDGFNAKKMKCSKMIEVFDAFKEVNASFFMRIGVFQNETDGQQPSEEFSKQQSSLQNEDIITS